MAVNHEDWLQAQYSVIGAALLDSTVVPKVMAETSQKDFSGSCLTVYNAIRKVFLSGGVVDPVSVGAVVGPDYREFIMQVMEVVPTAANVDHYIRICREQARILAIQDIGQKLAGANDSEKARELLENANSLLVAKPSLKIVTMSDALTSFMNRHVGRPDYLSWPIRELNDRIYAELGDFIIVGGYPSSGKSAWVMQCGAHWARKYKVGFFSLETSSEKLFDRQMSLLAKISMDEIKRNTISESEWERVAMMNQEITALSMELVPAAGMTPADIRAVTMMRGYQIIIIDYLQLLQSSGGNRTEQVTATSIALHTLAQSLGVTVVALSQLARPNQQNKNAPPDMAALRESGQIEQDADLIMMLSLEKKEQPDGNRELRIRKNKEGTCPNILLAFDGKHQTFSKAKRTNDLLGKYVAEGKSIRHRNKQVTQESQQMTLLPDDTPVPF